MKFSLVMGTLGRPGEVARFLRALDSQAHRDFELILIDQSSDGRLESVVAEYASRFPIVHRRDARRGLSRARNIGLHYVSGAVVAFPDDDCWYPAALLRTIDDLLERHSEWHGVTGVSVDEAGRASSARWDRQPGRVDRFNVWTRAISFTIFVRRPVVAAIGDFDEDLGTGSSTRYQSGEETDYLVRAIDLGADVRFVPSLRVHHPDRMTSADQVAQSRASRYAPGVGRVLRKHRYPLWFAAYLCARPLGGVTLSLMCGRWDWAQLYWRTFIGRVDGWLR